MRFVRGSGVRGAYGGYGSGSGPRLMFGPGRGMPPMVKALILTNIGIYLLGRLSGWNLEWVQTTFGLVPRDLFAHGRLWQLVTYQFLHGGVLHVGVNMFILWMFGTAVESAWGSRDFLTYYLVFGASGAVLGVILAYGLMYPEQKVYVYFLLPIKMKYFVWIVALIDLVAGLGANDGIGHWAHLGGMLTGYLYLKQDWRLGYLRRKVMGARARQRMAWQNRQAQAHQRDLQTVDEILDKISTHGIDSLTEKERKILREASRH